VITASSAMEYAFEGDQLADAQELAPSVFTNALVEGLESGEADRDQDGLVALDELYDYVYDKVRATTPNQTPGKWTFGVQGELYIARRSQPVSTPAPLPPELQQAIDSPFAGVRAGAVQELKHLLSGRHAGLALAARLSLDRLVEDDSRMVSDIAAAALEAEATAKQEINATAAHHAEERKLSAIDEIAQHLRSGDPSTVASAEGALHRLANDDSRRVAQTAESLLADWEAEKQARQEAEQRLSQVLRWQARRLTGRVSISNKVKPSIGQRKPLRSASAKSRHARQRRRRRAGSPLRLVPLQHPRQVITYIKLPKDQCGYR
jgi:hypothetical protein